MGERQDLPLPVGSYDAAIVLAAGAAVALRGARGRSQGVVADDDSNLQAMKLDHWRQLLAT